MSDPECIIAKVLTLHALLSSEETLARKKKIRAAHRTSATRLMGQAGALIEATPVNADELTLLQTNLSTKLTTLEAIQR